ncbi:MAG: MipA/OmpV family protein [Cognaticolwellia sp.]
MLNVRTWSKALCSTTLLSTLVISGGVAAQEWKFSAGLGLYTKNAAWKEIDSQIGVAPLISASYGNWQFLKDGLVSYSVLDEDDFGFSVGINARDGGYDSSSFLASKSSDALVFNGYKSPSEEVTIKVNGNWQFLELNLEQDVSGHSKGLTADLGAKFPLLMLDNGFILNASATVHWQSSDFANYIYGIAGEQIDNSLGRTAYSLDSVTNYSLGLSGFYKLNKAWNLIASVNYTKLDNAVSDSPLIDNDKVTGTFVGAVYSF